MNHQGLSVDFGSAFTKLAGRRGWDSRGELKYDLPLSHPSDSHRIPSVIAVVQKGGTETYLFGFEASSQMPSERVRSYRNWKAALFDSSSIQPHSRSSLDALSASTAQELTLRYFRELRVRLGSAGE